MQPQQDFYQPEVQPQFYPEPQPVNVQPQSTFYTEPQPSKPFHDEGRGKLAPWAANKKWGQHFEVLRTEVKPKVSRRTPDKNEPRPPNKKSSKAKQTVAKKSNEVTTKSTNSKKKIESKESKSDKIKTLAKKSNEATTKSSNTNKKI